MNLYRVDFHNGNEIENRVKYVIATSTESAISKLKSIYTKAVIDIISFQGQDVIV